MAILGVVIPTIDNSEEVEFLDKMTEFYQREINAVDNSMVKGGMCAKYNYAIDWYLKEYSETADNDWIVFQHNDAKPITSLLQIEQKLEEAREKGAAVVGVAGSLVVPPVSPGFWWHGLGTPQFRGAGAVQHPLRDPNKPDELATLSMDIMNFYGPYPRRVAAFDGVWFAINMGSLRKHRQLKFDEKTFDNDYHYYDADFCATVRSLSLDMYIMGIIIHHDSPGISMLSTGFLLAQKKFLKKWWKNQEQYAKFEVKEDK